MKVTLNIPVAANEINEIELDKPVTIIGRGVDCDLRIPANNCSRRHCEICIEDDLVFVRDLRSSNGIYVNNEKVTKTEIQAGDIISIGPIKVGIKINDQPENFPFLAGEVDLDLEIMSHGFTGDSGETAPFSRARDEKYYEG